MGGSEYKIDKKLIENNNFGSGSLRPNHYKYRFGSRAQGTVSLQSFYRKKNTNLAG